MKCRQSIQSNWKLAALALSSTLSLATPLTVAQVSLAETLSATTADPVIPIDGTKPLTPTRVQVMSGCRGKATWNPTQKTYQLSAVNSAPGWLINTEGDIVTNANLVQSSSNRNLCEDLLWRNFVRQVAVDKGWNPATVLQNQAQLDTLGQQSKLLDYQPVQTVALPSGRQVAYEIKSLSAPLGTDKTKALIQITSTDFRQLGYQSGKP
jgi:hypothetical protein